MCFPPLPAAYETCRLHIAMETRAKCWTLSRDKAEEEILREGELACKIAAIVSIPQ